MNLGFPALLYFRKVAELQHLTHAAKELHIAQPSLSRIIHGMEEELGIPLFERDGFYRYITLQHTAASPADESGIYVRIVQNYFIHHFSDFIYQQAGLQKGR